MGVSSAKLQLSIFWGLRGRKLFVVGSSGGINFGRAFQVDEPGRRNCWRGRTGGLAASSEGF